MIESVANEFYVSLLWAVVAVGTVFVLWRLANLVPHRCWYLNPDRSFDRGTLFCHHCLSVLFSRHFTRRMHVTFATFLLFFTPCYIAYALVRAHYAHQFNVSDMAVVCLLCLFTRFVNRTFFPEDSTTPVVCACALLAVTCLLLRLSANFVLLSMVMCWFNMVICALQRLAAWMAVHWPAAERELAELRRLNEMERILDAVGDQPIVNGIDNTVRWPRWRWA